MVQATGTGPALRTPAKSATAFRTISEVSIELDVPQHVLRFWETKFPQIRPLKRGGGRRYYRPDDVETLRRIQHFLYSEGYTIKGVQRLLKETRGGAVDVAIPTDGGLFDRDEVAAILDEEDPDDDAVDGHAAVGDEAEEEMADLGMGPGLSDRQRRLLTDILEELQDLRTLLHRIWA